MNKYLYNKHSNKKIIIILILIILFALFIYSKHLTNANNTEENDNVKKITTFYNDDNSISVELPKTYNLKKTDSDYLLKLISDENLCIYIDKKNAIENKSLEDIANADKEAFLEKFSNTSNISEIKALNVGDNQAYIYSFHYLDSQMKTAFYLQTVWLEIDNNIYVFDIEFPLNDLANYTNIATDVLSTFQILNNSI